MDQSAINQVEAPGRVRCEFYFDEDHNCDMAKIWIIGDTGNLLKRAGPDVIARWPKEWELYQKTGGARDMQQPIGGTPLREVPGLERDSIAVLRYHAVRNVEELAALDEATIRNIGAGYLNFWRSAKLILQAREADQLRELLAEKEQATKLKRGPGRPRKDESDKPEDDAEA